MRFVQAACQLEGLHYFFYDLMYLLVTMSVNIRKREKKIMRKIWRPITPELHLEALQISSPTNGGPDLVKGAQTNYLWICD